MNTRSKTRELIGLGEMCCVCFGLIDETFYATFCQANERICNKCIVNKCEECNKQIVLEHKVYVLDGMSIFRLLCKDCFDEND